MFKQKKDLLKQKAFDIMNKLYREVQTKIMRRPRGQEQKRGAKHEGRNPSRL